MNATRRKVLKAMARLAGAQAEWAVAQRDETFAANLFPPATKDELQALTTRSGIALPRTYKAFLSLSNGWDNFNGNAKLLSTTDSEQDWFTSRMNQIAEHFAEFDEPPLPQSALFVMLGVDEPDFAYIDLDTPGGVDERIVIHHDLIEGELGRYPSFLDYLKAECKTTRELVTDAFAELG